MRALCLLSVVWLLSACDEKDSTPLVDDVDAGTFATEQQESSEETAPPRKKRPKSIVLAEVNTKVPSLVADGFLTRDEILEEMVDFAGRESLRTELAKVIDEALAAHRAEEKTWSMLTDADRLDRAFAVLQAKGITAQPRIGDCHDCAQKALDVLDSQAVRQGKQLRGYVYFTDADSDGVSLHGSLLLVTGAFTADPQTIHDEVVSALATQGLVAEDDEMEGRLQLNDLEWKKRRFTKAPSR